VLGDIKAGRAPSPVKLFGPLAANLFERHRAPVGSERRE
jgi:hypothetical protein